MNRKLPGLDQNIQLGSKMMVEERTSHGWLHIKRNGKLSSGKKSQGGYHFSSETKLNLY